jgi:multidrug efflux system membrane fusion protein
MKFRPLAISIIAVSVLAGAGYLILDPATTAAPARTAGANAVPVVVAAAEQRQVPITVGVIGTVQAYSTVSVRSQVDGQIVAASFKEGQMVKKGDLLFTIDPRPFQAQLAQAQATLARDQAQLEGSRKDLERTQQLSKQGVSSRQLLDQAIAAEKAAAATVKADEAAVQMVQLQLNYTSIQSPVDGRTGSLLVNVGNLVMANGTSALLTINQVQPIYVTFSVPEKYLPEIKRRMVDGPLRVTAKVPGDSGPPEVGQVDFVSNAADTTTGTIQLRGTFANSAEHLTPGQLVDTMLTLYTIENAVTVPDPAIQNTQRGNAVFAVKPDMTVEVRPVTIGVSHQGYTVIADGVAVGDTVVVEGQLRLRPGTKVRAADAAPAVPAPAGAANPFM